MTALAAASAKTAVFFCLFSFINQSGRRRVAGSHDKIGQFSHAARGGGKKLQCVFDKLDNHAEERPEGKGAYEGAGKSDKSILAKEGDSGTGNSAKERAYAIAESRAAAVRVWALRAAGLFCCPSESVLFMFFPF